MIYNANLIITNKCNSKCTNCNIWKYGKKDKEMTLEEIEKLFLLPELSNITELGISGGEPFLRSDLSQIIEKILSVNPKIEKFYLTTNASMPENVMKVCEVIKNKNRKLCIGVSIDGDKETNKMIRGVDSYDNAVSLINKIVEKYPAFDVQISLTICERNCNIENLEHIKNLAKKLKCDYSFRIAETSEQFYRNKEVDNNLNLEQKNLIIKFIIDNKLDDKFMKEALYYYVTGKVPVMYDYQKHANKCEAGKSFVFIQSDGKIYPCIYSSECIGDINGFYADNNKTYLTSKCPCMTECTVWPMIIKYDNSKEG